MPTQAMPSLPPRGARRADRTIHVVVPGTRRSATGARTRALRRAAAVHAEEAPRAVRRRESRPA